MNVLINVGGTGRWESSGTTFVRGSAFTMDSHQGPAHLAESLLMVESFDDFLVHIKNLNGFYAVVHRKGDAVLVAVDRVRSIPLFYAVKDGVLLVSDNARWIRHQAGHQGIDDTATAEFMLTGYVTGAGTLSASVKQVRAGEALMFFSESNEVRVRSSRYYQFAHLAPTLQGQDAQEELDNVLLGIFERLIRYANGRQVIVPLSGGYDSRLIVIMLKRLGYDNLVTFSYGRPGNPESQISRKVAERLGVQWEFVPYSEETWNQWFDSAERKHYYEISDGLCSLPHIQDWLAVSELKRRGVIEDDCIFVPGHSADLLAGSRSIPHPELYREGPPILDSVIKALLEYHYSNWDWSHNHDILYPMFRQRIVESLGDISLFQNGASAFESWDVQERQAKFIINSVRVYEYFGFDWWLPFWDADFMDFWSKVSIGDRKDEGMYIRYVSELFSKLAGLQQVEASKSERSSVVSRIKEWARKNPLFSPVFKFAKRRMAYRQHPLAIYGVVPLVEFKRFYTGRESVNSFLIRHYLGEVREFLP